LGVRTKPSINERSRGRRDERAMRSVKMKDFSFGMFYNETKFIQKFGHYIIAIKKKRVVNVKQFVLENKKAIIYEKNDRYGNVEIF